MNGVSVASEPRGLPRIAARGVSGKYRTPDGASVLTFVVLTDMTVEMLRRREGGGGTASLSLAAVAALQSACANAAYTADAVALILQFVGLAECAA